MTISVIIPAYNEEKYIVSCLHSILGNAPENLKEIFVINNASTDKTAELAEKFPQVRVVNEPNKGLTKARQRGLQEAWEICWLLWTPTAWCRKTGLKLLTRNFQRTKTWFA